MQKCTSTKFAHFKIFLKIGHKELKNDFKKREFKELSFLVLFVDRLLCVIGLTEDKPPTDTLSDAYGHLPQWSGTNGAVVTT